MVIEDEEALALILKYNLEKKVIRRMGIPRQQSRPPGRKDPPVGYSFGLDASGAFRR